MNLDAEAVESSLFYSSAFYSYEILLELNSVEWIPD
jgi:hypothetical protein